MPNFKSGVMFMDNENAIKENQCVEEMFKGLKCLMNDVNAFMKKISMIFKKCGGG